MEPLSPALRRALRAQAHHVDPVVTIGHHGLTPAVLHEIDVALTAHELVKVRVMGDDRSARDALIPGICSALDCASVQQIGKLLVLWRPRPAEAPPAPADAKRPRTAERPAARRSTTSPKAPRSVPRAPMPRRRRGV
jgi:putative YhbY family RNA-binding protein